MAKKLELMQVEPPLSGLSPEELAKTLDEIGAKARSAYERTTNDLLDLLSKNDPVAILARMGWRYFATQSVESQQRWPAGEQHHLELLQALALRGSPPEPPESVREADVVEKIAELLDTNAAAFNLSRIKGAGAGPDDKRHLR